MLTMKVYKEQVVFFFREGSSFKAYELSMALYNQLKIVFKNSEPTVLPVPNDAPADVPRCVWNDYNTKLSYSFQSLNLTIDIPSTHNWAKLVSELTTLISNAFSQCGLSIDRIGVVVEANADSDLHQLIKESVSIPHFTCETEANISWLDHEDKYNVWTYLNIDVSHEVNRIVYDVNNQTEYKLSEQGICVLDAVESALNILKERVTNGI